MDHTPLKDAREPFVLSLDLGTSSIRASIYDVSGRAVEGLSNKVPYQLRIDDEGRADADPLELFETTVQAIDGVLAAAGDRAKDIAAVASCSLVSNVLGITEDGTPTTPVYTWADTRPASDAADLRRRIDQDAWHARTGTVIHTSYLPARFLWLHRTQPDKVAATRYWLSLGEYLYLRLLGKRVCSYSVASWTGLLNRHSLEWDAETLAELPIEAEQLSPLADFSDALSGLNDEYARRWPVLAEVPWYLTVGDGAAANVGSGCTDPKRAAITVGTSGAIRVIVPQVEKVPHGLWAYRVDKDRVLLGGAISNGGILFDWLRRTLNIEEVGGLEGQIARMEPDAHGLTVLPFLAGERSPGWAPDAKAAFIGLTIGTSPAEIVRAGLEAVAYRFALIYRALREEVPDVASFLASGGSMLASPAWAQIIADVLGATITTCAEAEATSRGNALLALEALGAIESLSALPPATGRTFSPNMDHYTIYKDAIARQEDLYDRLLG